MTNFLLLFLPLFCMFSLLLCPNFASSHLALCNVAFGKSWQCKMTFHAVFCWRCTHYCVESLAHSILLSTCRQVREAERYSWAATRGVNEEILLENLPEDLQRQIRHHLFNFVKKVRCKVHASDYFCQLLTICLYLLAVQSVETWSCFKIRLFELVFFFYCCSTYQSMIHSKNLSSINYGNLEKDIILCIANCIFN